MGFCARARGARAHLDGVEQLDRNRIEQLCTAVHTAQPLRIFSTSRTRSEVIGPTLAGGSLHLLRGPE